MDFTGGTSTNVTFNEDMSLDDISAKVVPVVSKITGDADVQTQKVAGTNEVIIKTKTLDVEQRQQLEDAMVEILVLTLKITRREHFRRSQHRDEEGCRMGCDHCNSSDAAVHLVPL